MNSNTETRTVGMADFGKQVYHVVTTATNDHGQFKSACGGAAVSQRNVFVPADEGTWAANVTVTCAKCAKS